MESIVTYCTLLLSFVTLISTAILPADFQNQIRQRSRLSLADTAEWTEYNIFEPDGTGSYSFGYDVDDVDGGNVQFRVEERNSNGTVKGSYGFVTPDGSVHVVHYIADHLGYRTRVEDSKRSAFRSNLPNSDKISPQMLSALQSLQNYGRYQKEDQHVRPIDQLYPTSHVEPNEMANKNEPPKHNSNNYQENKHIYYNTYLVPPNVAY